MFELLCLPCQHVPSSCCPSCSLHAVLICHVTKSPMPLLLAAYQSCMKVSMHHRMNSLSNDVSIHSEKQTGLLTSQMLKVQMECISMAVACIPSGLSASGLCRHRMCFASKPTRVSMCLISIQCFCHLTGSASHLPQGDRCIVCGLGNLTPWPS